MMQYFKENTEQEKAAALVRKPLDEVTGKEMEKCSHAFFPGCGLCGGEPEIVVKAYDSLRFQKPDTAIHIQCCQTDDMRENWEALGCPTLITACMGCRKKLQANHPDIPTVPLYDMLQDMGVSGGCHSQDYILFDPGMEEHPQETVEAVKALADGMGVTLHTMEEDGKYPYLTYNIRIRDMCKREGKDAVHILELIYGMGASNTHMISEHDHHHDGEDAACDGDCETCGVGCGERGACDGQKEPPAPLPTEEEKMANRFMLKDVMLGLFWE